MNSVECIVIGAGVVGLACARALSLAGHEVIVLEKNSGIGAETSSRNSEVIHSGIYYPTGSLKALTCVKGRELLYSYCEKHKIDHVKLGKLVVATSHTELQEIKRLLIKGQQNGVTDLQLLNREQTLVKEPNLSCMGALWSPSTGIVDSHSFMLAMQGEIEDHGGTIAFNTPVLGGEIRSETVVLHTGGETPYIVNCRLVINCAGLKAQNVAKKLKGLDSHYVPDQYLARGNYFSLSGKSPFSHLIYPAPEPGGLGVHATLDLAGQCRFGPDVEWVEDIDYEVHPSRGILFYEKIRRYWPSLRDGQLQPAYSGIRPKIVGAGEAAGDFIVVGPETHGGGPCISLFGIESPGLTASMALADSVLELARPIFEV